MRITNKMMTNNMMSNITKNKFNITSLEQQYTTGKKIQRPSEDPIVAVRALKLRTNLTELEQYYNKNIPDAKSWMDVTESALKTVNSILRQINTYCVQGSTDSLTASDRSAIVENLQEMKAQIYQEGNTNYAGRYVFTGYKTDTSLVFNDTTNNLNYAITEKFTGENIQIGTKVSGSYVLGDFNNTAITFDNPPRLVNTYRIQLSYDKLSNTDIDSINYSKLVNGVSVDQTPITNITSISATDPAAYIPDDDAIHFIAETGELVLGKNRYHELKDADNISMTYNKSTFAEGDLRPEHYFNCTVTDNNHPDRGPVTYTKTNQSIQYEVNFNQKLVINTQGSDAISHKIGRDIDDILNSVNDVIHTEQKIAEVNKRLEDTALSQEDKKRYERMLEQLTTELVLKKDIMQKNFSNGMASSSNEQDRVNVAVADLGSRYVRLELTESRLSSQKVDFEELLSNNEDADVVDTLIKYTAAEAIYRASLSAAAKVVKNSLLDFL